MKQISLSAQYIFVRGRQLEGTYPGDARTGIWPITGNRVARGWGFVREEDWPYDDSVWPPVEPPGLDQIAMKKPDFYYQRVRTLDECKAVLGRLQCPVKVSLDISDKWYDAPGGRIPDSTPHVSLGSHVVLLHGYDDSRGEFSFQNSWGVDWGDEGHGYIPYSVFEQTWVEGWLTDLAAKPMDDNPASGIAERCWGVFEHGGGILHCHEFVDCTAGKIGWSFFIERDDSVEVEELFVMPAFRNRGYATRLVRLIANFARKRNASLTIWIPHADTAPETMRIIEKFAVRLGLRVSPSPVTWASYVVCNPSARVCKGGGVSPPGAIRPCSPRPGL